MVKKASSTFCAFFALVSRNGIDRLSANALAVSCDTALLSVMSLLLPTRSLHVPSVAYLFTSFSQSLTWSKDSYTEDDAIKDPNSNVRAKLELARKMYSAATYLARDVINHDDTVCSTVIRARDRSESLLSCRIPLETSQHPSAFTFCLTNANKSMATSDRDLQSGASQSCCRSSQCETAVMNIYATICSCQNPFVALFRLSVSPIHVQSPRQW